jgi:hypothetical protein
MQNIEARVHLLLGRRLSTRTSGSSHTLPCQRWHPLCSCVSIGLVLSRSWTLCSSSFCQVVRYSAAAAVEGVTLRKTADQCQ